MSKYSLHPHSTHLISPQTVSSIMTFFLAMTLFPAVQEKASSEISAAIGPHRLPVSSDRSKLPYIEAIMKETHRWLLVAPMGLPHASTAEDTCRGYRIPAGSLLLANNFHFTHDPNVYPDPMVFRPERYLESPTQPDPRQFVFGYGRRICPGRHVADNALFVTIAQVLTVFDIRKVVGRDGKDVEPEVRFVPGVIAHPVPFRCKIKVKKGREELVRKSQEQYPLGESDAEELENVGW
jgi:cytochrome P450